tara:strand:- start:44780 stop:45199 length:420 start_codon:yes stop_codon:yes gene_type:complete
MSLLDRVLSSKITPAPLPEIAAKLGASYDDIEDLNLPFYDIATSSYPDSYIIVKTALYTHQNASCMMLSSDLYDENGNGDHVDSLLDAESPCSFASGLMETWTLDLSLSKARIDAIRDIVKATVAANLDGELAEDFKNW